jgi:uncharacterized protein DUF4365
VQLLKTPIPGTTAKEWVSLAFFKGLIAQALLNSTTIDWDDGYDLQVGSTKPMSKQHDVGPVFISIQLKARTVASPDSSRACRVDRRTFDRLANPNSIHDQYLVAYFMCRKRADWINPEENGSQFNYCAYYKSLKGMSPPKSNSKSVNIEFCDRDLLTSTVLNNLVREEFAKWM